MGEFRPPRYALRYGNSVAAPPYSIESTLEDVAYLLEDPPTRQTNSGQYESRSCRCGTTGNSRRVTPTDNPRRSSPKRRHEARGTRPTSTRGITGGITRGRPRGIRHATTRVISIPILAPLANIPIHIVQTPRIWLLATYWMSCAIRIVPEPVVSV